MPVKGAIDQYMFTLIAMTLDAKYSTSKTRTTKETSTHTGNMLVVNQCESHYVMVKMLR